MRFAVMVDVCLKSGIADPAGSTIERSLPAIGYEGVDNVKVGKTVRFDIESSNEEAARVLVEDLCADFLINPVMEDAEITLVKVELEKEV